MKRMVFVLLYCCIVMNFSCGGEDLQGVAGTPPEENKVCRNMPSWIEAPITIKIWLDSRVMLNEEFIMSSLNQYWNEVGVRVERADTHESTDVGFIYVSGRCSKPIEIGRMQYKYWANFNSIIVDYDCFKIIPNYLKKFPATASHALGNLMGIQGYPGFCSDGVMSNSVLRMEQEKNPARLSDGDKKGFFKRSKFATQLRHEQICKAKEDWKCGESHSASRKTNTFWANPVFDSVPIEQSLNKYYDFFGRNFIQVENKADANFVINDWGEKYIKCSPLAITYNSSSEIKIKSAMCLDKDKPYWDASIIVHEVGHLFGMEHIPSWCGNAIMDPFINPGKCFTATDVNGWEHRDLKLAVLE